MNIPLFPVIAVSRSPEPPAFCHSERAKRPKNLAQDKLREAISTNSMNSTNPINYGGDVDAVIVAVAHNAFNEITLDDLKAIMNNDPILISVRGICDAKQAKEAGFHYATL